MSAFLITKDMLTNLKYDQYDDYTNQQDRWASIVKSTNTVVVVFKNSDQNAVIHQIKKSIENPIKNGIITTILIEELAIRDFLDIFLQSLENLTAECKVIKNTSESETRDQLNESVIASISSICGMSTLIVSDLYDKSLKTQDERIITLHTFRNTKECLTLINADSGYFDSASIWLDNYSYAYELIASLNCKTYFLNCNQICLKHLHEQSTSFAIIHNGYHFEAIYINNERKVIVYPVNIPKQITN